MEFAEYSYDRSGETWQGCPAARDVRMLLFHRLLLRRRNQASVPLDTDNQARSGREVAAPIEEEIWPRGLRALPACRHGHGCFDLGRA